MPKEQEIRRPLPPGSVIECDSMSATVVCDHGTSVDVLHEGFRQTWRPDAGAFRVVSVPAGAPYYAGFDAYARDFPEGERFRAWVTKGNALSTRLYRLIDPPHAGSPHGGLPGNYMVAKVYASRDASVRIAAHDCDDGLMVRDFACAASGDVEPAQKAEEVLREMCELVPFSMWDAAEVFGFRWE